MTKIYFSGLYVDPATNQSYGRELMVFDGQTVTLAKDLTSGIFGSYAPVSQPSDPREITSFNGKLYFSSALGGGGNTEDFRTLVEFDPSTSLAREIIGDRNISSPGLPAERADGDELFMPRIDQSYVNPKELTVVGDKLYFSGHFVSPTGVSSGRELMVFDGTSASLAVDLTSAVYGTNIPSSTSSDPREFTAFNGKLYFSSAYGTGGVEEFRTLVEFDPATGLAREIISNRYLGPGMPAERADGDELFIPHIDFSYVDPKELTVVGDKLYFSGHFRSPTGVSSGRELMVFDGTTASLAVDLTSAVYGTLTAASAPSDPREITSFNGKLYFSSAFGAGGVEDFRTLVEYDPATGMAREIINDRYVAPGVPVERNDGDEFFMPRIDQNYVNPKELTVVGGKLYFSGFYVATSGNSYGAGGSSLGRELMVFDGTTVSLASELTQGLFGTGVPANWSSDPRDLVVMDGKLYFSSAYGGSGTEDFRTLVEYNPGTGAVREVVNDIPGNNFSFIPERNDGDESFIPRIDFSYIAPTQLVAVATTGDDNFQGTSAPDIVDLQAGNDVYDAGPGNDTITGGLGANSVLGGTGNDTFIAVAADLVAGESMDGGDGTDTLRIDGGGSASLDGIALTSVERITLTDTVGTTLTVVSEAQAALVFSAAGAADTVVIQNFDFWGQSFAPLGTTFDHLFDAGVETVAWIEGGGDNTAKRDGAGVVTITGTDTTGQTWETSELVFNAAGERETFHVEFDDGHTSHTTFANNIIAEYKVDNLVDSPATGHMKSIVDTYDSAGRLDTHEIVHHANGASVLTLRGHYDDAGVRTSYDLDQVDSAGTHGWTVNDQTFTDAGVLTAQHVIANTGNVIDRSYASGVITQEIITDGGAADPWATITTDYAAGAFKQQMFVYDNDTSFVQGNAGANSITGRSGPGVALDILAGRDGADTFVFAANFGTDVITDFTDGADKLDLTAFGVTDFASLDAIGDVYASNGGVAIDIGTNRIQLTGFSLTNFGDGDLVS